MNQSTDDGVLIDSVDGRRISRIWIVPIVALVVGALVIWQSIAEQGPLIEIHFDQGHGITAGKTEVKYADVTVGLIEAVSLSDDLSKVIVQARLEPFMAPFLGDTTQFWVVKADFRGANISGLGTLFSGAYIEAGWEETPSVGRRQFVGLNERPLTRPGSNGRHFKLTAPDASSVSVGSPVFYRNLPVGQVEAVAMSPDFNAVDFTAFVEAPYDRLLTSTTRFWNVSGVDVDLGFDGVRLHVNSLNSLVAGGVAFGNIGASKTDAAFEPEAPYRLYPNHDSAIEAGFEITEGNGYLLMAEFDESIRGLEVGAPVEWQGILVGRVRDVVLDLGPGDPSERQIYAVIEMQPARVGLESLSDEELKRGLSEWVQSGMRAQLASGNVFTGRKLVRLIDQAAPADAAISIDFDAQPYPQLPTITAANLGAVSSNVQKIVANLAELPVDQLARSLISLVDGASALVSDPNLEAVPGELREALIALNDTASNLSDASENLPELIDQMITVVAAGDEALAGLSPDSELYSELSGALGELRDATRAVAQVLQTLEDKPNALFLGK
ncbi:MAG: MlaD family protein [Pseudomonadota bacterium]